MDLIAFALAWIALGWAAALLLPTEQESRFAWLPVAVCFGPLWAFVAMEMRNDAAERMDAITASGVHDFESSSTPSRNGS